MRTSYNGPLRDGPLAVELHNTLYAAGGVVVDGLASRDQAAAFVKAIETRLGPGLPAGPGPSTARLTALREQVRDALRSTAGGRRPGAASIAALNDAAGRAPRSAALASGGRGRLRAATNHHGATRADIILAAFATDAIELIAGDVALATCGAPGCVLLYMRDQPRRAWCCNACGNRARQARHYRRTHR